MALAETIFILFLLFRGTLWAHAAVNCNETGAGRFPDLSDEKCMKYTLCIYVQASDSYLAYNAVCPNVSLFDPKISRCTISSNYICKTRSHKPKPLNTTICTFDGYIADPEPTNCSTYYQCVKIKGTFTQIKHRCPYTTYYNPKTTLCDSNYTCTDYVCSSSGRIADKSDINCRKYYYCVHLYNGTYAQFKYICPKDSVFNPETKLCTTNYVCS